MKIQSLVVLHLCNCNCICAIFNQKKNECLIFICDHKNNYYIVYQLHNGFFLKLNDNFREMNKLFDIVLYIASSIGAAAAVRFVSTIQLLFAILIEHKTKLSVRN